MQKQQSKQTKQKQTKQKRCYKQIRALMEISICGGAWTDSCRAFQMQGHDRQCSGRVLKPCHYKYNEAGLHDVGWNKQL